MEKETDIQTQETKRFSNKMNQKRHTPRYTLIKMPKVKVKERLLKATRDKKLVRTREPP